MTDAILHAGGTIEPTLILGYSSRRESGNLTHTIPGRGYPDATLRPAQLRTGTLTLGFEGPTSEADSRAAEDAHATGSIFTLLADARQTVEMHYYPNGSISRDLEDETRDAWIVTVDFQEVPSA